MTLEEAQANIGRSVVYCPGHGPFENGVITEVRGENVFVRYQGQENAKATPAHSLYLASEYNPRDAWRDWKMESR